MHPALQRLVHPLEGESGPLVVAGEGRGCIGRSASICCFPKQRLGMGQASGRLEPAVCPHIESGDLRASPTHCLPFLQGPGLPGGSSNFSWEPCIERRQRPGSALGCQFTWPVGLGQGQSPNPLHPPHRGLQMDGRGRKPYHPVRLLHSAGIRLGGPPGPGQEGGEGW